MPIVITAPTGDTLTLSEDGEWTGTDATLVEMAEQIVGAPGDDYKADPMMEWAKSAAELIPGARIEEVNRPDEEDLPDGAVP